MTLDFSTVFLKQVLGLAEEVRNKCCVPISVVLLLGGLNSFCIAQDRHKTIKWKLGGSRWKEHS